MTAHYEVRGSVAVITLDNPPVNGLGFATRAAVAAGVERAEADPAITSIVITGAGKAFSGGADIKEFGSPKARGRRWVPPAPGSRPSFTSGSATLVPVSATR